MSLCWFSFFFSWHHNSCNHWLSIFFRIINSLLFLVLFVLSITLSNLFYFILSTLTKYFGELTMYCSRYEGDSIKSDRWGSYLYEACVTFLSTACICTFVFFLLRSATKPYLLSPLPSVHTLVSPTAHHLKGILQRSVFQLFFFFSYTPSLMLYPFSQGQIQILCKCFPNLIITSVVSLYLFIYWENIP